MTTQAEAGSTTETSTIDEFAEVLLDALYAIGLMPLRLAEAPAKFDKYPQELFARLEVYRNGKDVERAFNEWETLLLRKPDYREKVAYAFPYLERLRGWMKKHRDLLYERTTISHLRKSMFGRSYTYLYPRISLVMEYLDMCKREQQGLTVIEDEKRPQAVSDLAFIDEHFSSYTPVTQERMREILDPHQRERAMRGAQALLLQNQPYFEAALRNKGQSTEGRG